MRGEDGMWRAILLVIGRLLISPLVYVIAMLFCALTMAFYSLVVWPLTGSTTIRLGWEDKKDGWRD